MNGKRRTANRERRNDYLEHDDEDDKRLMRRQKTEPARVEVLVS